MERKSLSDLRQSFTSGRLFHQAESMSRHYETPILLIEFDRDKAFILHSPADISADIQVCSLDFAGAVVFWNGTTNLTTTLLSWGFNPISCRQDMEGFGYDLTVLSLYQVRGVFTLGMPKTEAA